MTQKPFRSPYFMKSTRDSKSCCQAEESRENGFLSGFLYGILPHTGCIAFLLFSLLGITTATALLRPLMLSPYFFWGLIGLSLFFATLSAAVYLKRMGLLSFAGAKRKKKYLTFLYGTAMSVNLLLFLVVFPLAGNVSSSQDVQSQSSSSPATLTLRVDIPCPGHAPLITGELKSIPGVSRIEYKAPDIFVVTFDPRLTSKEKILSLEVFKTFRATIVK